MHRFFVSSHIRSANSIALSGGIEHQISRVLRLRANEEIVLIPADAADAVEWRVRLVSVEARAVHGVIVAERSGLPEPTCAVALCPALLKGERFDWLLQKATELGVAMIQPIITARTIRKIGPDDAHALDRWRRIVTEAAEQSGRSRVPEVHGPVRLAALADALSVPIPIVVAHETVTTRALSDALPAGADRIAVAIGPEGGFADDEVARLMVEAGAVAVSLGPRILRAETAAITAVTLTMVATNNVAPPQERVWHAIRDTQELV